MSTVCGFVLVVPLQDTAGQEQYHALGPIYYRGSHAALVVYDITDTNSFIKVCMCLVYVCGMCAGLHYSVFVCCGLLQKPTYDYFILRKPL